VRPLGMRRSLIVDRMRQLAQRRTLSRPIRVARQRHEMKGSRMRNLTRRATTALMTVCVLFALFVSAIGVIGILGVRSATQSGSEIATGELTTSTMTAQLARSMYLVYSTAERALLSGDVSQRAELMSSLSSQLIPQVDVRLGDLQVLHASDPPAEIRDFQLFAKQWRTVRNLLSSSIVLGVRAR